MKYRVCFRVVNKTELWTTRIIKFKHRSPGTHKAEARYQSQCKRNHTGYTKLFFIWITLTNLQTMTLLYFSKIKEKFRSFVFIFAAHVLMKQTAIVNLFNLQITAPLIFSVERCLLNEVNREQFNCKEFSFLQGVS